MADPSRQALVAGGGGGVQRPKGTQTLGFPGSDKTTVGGGGEGHLQGTLSPCLCGAALVFQEMGLEGLRGWEWEKR